MYSCNTLLKTPKKMNDVFSLTKNPDPKIIQNVFIAKM